MSENTVKWHPFPQEKPKKDNKYLVSIKTRDYGFTSTSHWIGSHDTFRDYWDECISAWAELPEPYKEDS